MPKRKILINDGSYEQDQELVLLQITDIETKNNMRLAIRASEFAIAFGVNAILTKDQILFFIDQLRGKTKYLDSTHEIQEIKVDSGGADSQDTEEKILKNEEILSKYPNKEVIDYIEKENEK